MDSKIAHTALEASLAPAPNGWRAWVSVDAETRCAETPGFADAVASLPAESPQALAITVALPARLAIIERLTLPAHDREELDGMVRLQLEKTLPYPVEETTYGFQILSQTQKQPASEAPEAGGAAAAPVPETTLVACVIHNPTLEAFCAPLLERKLFPQRTGLWAMAVAAHVPPSGTAAALWREEANVVFAVFENGILSFLEILSSPENLSAELPHILMSAELAGASTAFCVALVDPALAEYREPVAKFLGVCTEELQGLETAPQAEPPVDLTLQSWRDQVVQREKTAKIRRGLMGVAAIYAVLLLLAFGYQGITGSRVRSVERELDKVRPQMEAVIAQRARWTALAPAIDSRRYPVELLYQVFQCLPSEEVRITKFQSAPTEFIVDGEAPDASQAVQFGQKLQTEPTVEEYHFEARPPVLLLNDHAQFHISAKL